MATYNRAHLLARSLVCYHNQQFDNSQLELVVVDDHSSDGTRDLVLSWSRSTGIRAVVVTDSPKTESWRDCGAVLNLGIRASTGKYVLLTHPEVLVGRRSVGACLDELLEFDANRRTKDKFGLYACCKVYYLSPQDQTRLDSVPWREEGVLAVRQIEGFYTDDKNGHPDFCHRATDIVARPQSRLPTWESFVFGGHSRETWKKLGGMLQTQKWGSVDVGWMHRRRTLGIPNHTCPDDDTICCHQNHSLPGDVPTDRNMDAWVEELKSYPLDNPHYLVYPAVDYL